jgi:hypothetical protein
VTAYAFRMPAGIPGEITRFQTYGATVKVEKQNVSTPVTAYGVLVFVDANGARPIGTGDTAMPAANQLGISVRPFPGPDTTVAFPSGSVPFGAGTPPATGLIDVLYRGYCSVSLKGAAAASRSSGVFVFDAASTGSHVLGGFEAAAGANLWALTNAQYMGPADASGNVEIGFNI